MAHDKKRNAIIEAAQKRFLHFGVDKTTMHEIAADLSISKASLYYYFPDKLSVYGAVLQKIIEAEQANEHASINEKDVQKAINKFLEARTEFIIKNHNLLEYLKTIGNDAPAELQSIFSSAKSRELNLIAKIIANGVKAKTLKLKDPQKIAELLTDCIGGLRLAVFSRKANFFPDKDQFYELLKREKEFTGIFFKGLSS